MGHMRPITAQLALYVGVFLGCLALAGLPACGASQRTKTLQSSMTAVNAARDGFVAFDREHEHQIVASAKPPSEGGTREEAEAAVAAYRMKTAPVWVAFEAAYLAIKLAAKQSDDVSLKAALAEIPKLLETLKKFKEGI